MTDLLHEQKIIILDFGSQYTQNIARKIRECEVYCEIHPCTMTLDKISEFKPKGIILSGGPASVLDKGSHLCDPKSRIRIFCSCSRSVMFCGVFL